MALFVPVREPLRFDDKDPADRVLEFIDWSRALHPGDIVQTSDWTAPAGLTVQQVAQQIDGHRTYHWIEDGVADTDYPITATITTAAGTVMQRTVWLLVRER